MKKNLILFIVIIISLSGCGREGNNSSSESVENYSEAVESQSAIQDKINNPTNNTIMPENIIDQNKNYTAVLKTDMGDIEISLNAKSTPITVNNFVWLAKKDFYKDVIFHRVIKDFMIQGGDPTGTGSGGPGYQFADEKFEGEYSRGTIAMANAGPDTNGSQFFIMHKDVPLPKNYVIFGKVTKGIEVVDAIATAETVLGADGAMSKPVNPVKIISISIIED